MLTRPSTISLVRPLVRRLTPSSARRSESIATPVDPLARWRAGGVAGKTIAFWGDSTIDLALVMFEIFDTQITTPGGELEGVTTVNLGSTGQTAAGALNDFAGVQAVGPNLVVARFGINDTRLGGVDVAELVRRVAALVDLITLNLPNCDIVLWTPNSLLSSDPGDTGYVVPLASAQAYTDIMWEAYNSMVGRWTHTVSVDSQQVFGRVCQPTSLLMNDILHPNNDGQRAELEQLLPFIVPTAIPLDLAASAAAWASNPAAPYTVYSRALEDTRYATLVRPFFISTYLDLGGSLLLYLGTRHGDSEPFTPDVFEAGDFMWTPNGVYELTGDEGKGVIGDGVQFYSGINTADFPPNDPPLGNARLYRRV